MDTTDSKITFDENGVCDHCQTFYKDIKPYWHTDEKGWLEISQIAEQIKKEGVGKNFDCIIDMNSCIV
ncbi:N-acetyl sugar amidotransferase, partial [Aliarcobacter lanthieri]